MTVFTKAKIIAPKAESSKSPLVDETVSFEASISVTAPRRRCIAPLLLHFMNITLVLMLVVSVGVVVYRQYDRTNTTHRYRGYCRIPVDAKVGELYPNDYRVLPLTWSPKPDMQVISTVDDSTTEEFVNVLREELDIDGMVEKISVVNNGQIVNFIHDFASNTTSIIDNDRCFTMELNRDVVMMPDAFVVSIERNTPFDVTNMRSALRALLPAVRDLAGLPAPCLERPTYRLRRDDRLVRKRSVDAPSHDYIHFSGKHIQAIEIGNLDELLEYEKKNKA